MKRTVTNMEPKKSVKAMTVTNTRLDADTYVVSMLIL